MTQAKTNASSLPHHRLIAYQLALELVKLVGRLRIGNAQLGQQGAKERGERGTELRGGRGQADAGR
jgi:hypothetical protein